MLLSQSAQTYLRNAISKIAKTLKERAAKLLESSDTEAIIDLPEDIDLAGAGWIKGYRGGFVNRGGGSFLNRRGCRDRGGFFNRR